MPVTALETSFYIYIDRGVCVWGVIMLEYVGVLGVGTW